MVKQSCTSAKSMSSRRDPRLLVRHGRGALRGREADVVEGRLVVRLTRHHRQADALHVDRIGAELLGAVGAAEHRGGGAVRRRAAVEQAERAVDHRRLQHRLLVDLHAQVRLGRQRAVVVVLHRDLGERGFRGAVRLEVAVGGEREDVRGAFAVVDHRVNAAGAVIAAVAHLLEAEHQRDVVHARGDRQRARCGTHPCRRRSTC